MDRSRASMKSAARSMPFVPRPRPSILSEARVVTSLRNRCTAASSILGGADTCAASQDATKRPIMITAPPRIDESANPRLSFAPMPSPIKDFIQHHYRHFNSAAMRAAADDYIKHLDSGGKMLVTIAGAMSTAEIGLSLAEMIRQGKVHAISCTGANLEEDIF